VDLVQHRLGADEQVVRVDLGRVERRPVAGDLEHRHPSERLELLADAGDAGPQVLEGRGPAGLAHHRPRGAAAGAREAPVVALADRRRAGLAAGRLAARGAREQAGPALAVEDAHHAVAPTEGLDQPLGVQTGASGVLAAAVDDVEDRPPFALDRPRGGEQGSPRLRLERGHG
jgi:hypothetical protein